MLIIRRSFGVPWLLMHTNIRTTPKLVPVMNRRPHSKGTHTIYGIHLKCEPHVDCYVWEEGLLGLRGGDLSLVRKGTFMGDMPLEVGEWEKWVHTSSPHAPMVWKSHFPCLLIKSFWYASDKECPYANLRSVMWEVGAKGYPVACWRGALRSFHAKAGRKRVVACKQLRACVIQGKQWRKTLPSA